MKMDKMPVLESEIEIYIRIKDLVDTICLIGLFFFSIW